MTPAARRKAVAHLMGHHEMSERRACKAMGFCRMTIRYETRRSDYNDHRPHSGLGWLTPAEFAQTINPRRDAVLRAGMAPHHTPPLPPRIQQPKTAGANSELDETWGQGHFECIQRKICFFVFCSLLVRLVVLSSGGYDIGTQCSEFWPCARSVPRSA